MASSYDQFLSETSGMGPVPKAQRGVSSNRNMKTRGRGRQWGMHGERSVKSNMRGMSAKPPSHKSSNNPGGGGGASRGRGG